MRYTVLCGVHAHTPHRVVRMRYTVLCGHAHTPYRVVRMRYTVLCGVHAHTPHRVVRMCIRDGASIRIRIRIRE